MNRPDDLRLARATWSGTVPDDDAWLRAHRRAETGRPISRELGQTEVQHLDQAGIGDHHVRRLEIAMGQSLLMRRGNGVDQRHRHVQQPTDGHPRCRDQLLERATLHELHRDEDTTVGRLDGVNGDDVGVVQGRDGFRFVLKTLAPIRVTGDGVGQDFDRDLAVQRRVQRGVDLAHTSCAERRENFVRPSLAPGGSAIQRAHFTGLFRSSFFVSSFFVLLSSSAIYNPFMCNLVHSHGPDFGFIVDTPEIRTLSPKPNG